MKHTRKILFCCLLLVGIPVFWTGCVGYVDAGPGYDRGGVWFHDDVWVDGGGRGGWGGHGGYVHPGGGRR